jgi:hypothetical protein
LFVGFIPGDELECLDAGTLGFQGYVDDDVAAVAYVKKLQARTSIDDGPQRFVGDAAAAYNCKALQRRRPGRSA